jgi:hypothetical protein
MAPSWISVQVAFHQTTEAKGRSAETHVQSRFGSDLVLLYGEGHTFKRVIVFAFLLALAGSPGRFSLV